MRHMTLRSVFTLLIITASTVGSRAQNAFLTSNGFPRYTKAGLDQPIVVRVRNAGSTAFFTFAVKWRLNGGAIQTMPPFTVGGGGIINNSFWEVTHPVPLNTTQGPKTLKVWVDVAGETDRTNDTLTFTFTALNTWAEKTVLLEARTESWCPLCPPSNNVTNLLDDDPLHAIAKFHLSDALDDCAECITYFQQYDQGFTPAGIFDMGDLGTSTLNANHPNWASEFTQRRTGVSPVELSLSSSLNSTTRQLTVSLTATYTYSFSGTHKLNVYLLEDNVPGPQANAPANYLHQGVMRAMLGGVNGTSGTIPTSPMVGTPYTATYTYTVPAGFSLSNLRLIGVAEHSTGAPNGRHTLNAVNRAASVVGIDELDLLNGRLQVYPNPFVNDLYVEVEDIAGSAQMELFTWDGRSVFQRNLTLNSSAATYLDLNGVGLVPGAYLLRITTAQGTTEQRVVKMD
jgi:hypothetical protein